jgi:hypothetical protein
VRELLLPLSKERRIEGERVNSRGVVLIMAVIVRGQDGGVKRVSV